MTPIERAMVRLIARGSPFTADDVTKAGAKALDPEHQANGEQSGIGALFRKYQAQQWITWPGEVVRSQAPHRKGGAIRVWEPTLPGQRAAKAVLLGRA